MFFIFLLTVLCLLIAMWVRQIAIKRRALRIIWTAGRHLTLDEIATSIRQERYATLVLLMGLHDEGKISLVNSRGELYAVLVT